MNVVLIFGQKVEITMMDYVIMKKKYSFVLNYSIQEIMNHIRDTVIKSVQEMINDVLLYMTSFPYYQRHFHYLKPNVQEYSWNTMAFDKWREFRLVNNEIHCLRKRRIFMKCLWEL